jgi:hypothetical protein
LQASEFGEGVALFLKHNGEEVGVPEDTPLRVFSLVESAGSCMVDVVPIKDLDAKDYS